MLLLKTLCVLLALSALTLLAVLLTRRRQLRVAGARQAAAEQRLQDAALSILDGQHPGPLSAADVRAVTPLVARYARQLTGEGRDAVRDWARRSGALATQLTALGSIRAPRRAEAALLLADLAGPGEQLQLVDALADKDADVRHCAARALGNIGDWIAVHALLHAHARGQLPASVAGQAVLNIGAADSARPIRRFASEPGDGQLLAVRLLAHVGGPADAALAGTLLDSVSAPALLRVAACDVLRAAGSETHRAVVLGALADRDPRVRSAAAHTAGVLGSRQDAAVLLPLTYDADYQVARSAARAVAVLAPDTLPALIVVPGCSPHLIEAHDLIGGVA